MWSLASMCSFQHKQKIKFLVKEVLLTVLIMSTLYSSVKNGDIIVLSRYMIEELAKILRAKLNGYYCIYDCVLPQNMTNDTG